MNDRRLGRSLDAGLAKFSANEATPQDHVAPVTAVSVEERIELAPGIRDALGRLRARVRLYLVAQGLALALCWMAAMFWISLGLDWFFEPPRELRGIAFAAALGGTAAILLRMVVGRLLVPLTDENLANLIERRFPEVGDGLLTAVYLTRAHAGGQSSTVADAWQCNRLMLSETCRAAAERIERLPLAAVFNFRPLRREAATAMLLSVAVGLFATAAPAAAGVWLRRNVFMSNERWPRKTHLEVAGLVDGAVKVARGADYTLRVRADMHWPVTPQVVEVRYRSETGIRGRGTMSREGLADARKDRYQDYSYTFRGVLSPIRFAVRGGDDRVDNLRIEVVESPVLVGMELACKFPAYMNRPDRLLPVSGAMSVPVGTEVTLRARANKPLIQVELEASRGDQAMPSRTLDIGARGADATALSIPLGTVAGDTTVQITLHDQDGIRSLTPMRLSLSAVVDESPQVAVRLDGIGNAITPQARLPLVGRVTDDYGMARLWVEGQLNQADAAPRDIETPSNSPTVIELHDAAIEASAWQPQPGQTLALTLKAADRFDLDAKSGPNVGLGERWQLSVVTPGQLRSMLESRELVLRQRFEAILSEMTETRDLLLRVNLGGTPPAAGAGGAPALGAGKAAGTSDSGAEPGDAPRESEASLSPDKQLSLALMRVQRAGQNSRKNMQETLGVAEAFEDIRKQLTNNRIDTEELKIRLQDGIASPLRHIADEMFPAFSQECDRLQENLASAELSRTHRQRALDQAEAILTAMRRVLDRMLEMEDFNDAVELLRKIIEMQGDVDNATRKAHRESIRGLIED